MWDLIVSVPDHCLSFYFNSKLLFVYNVSVTYCRYPRLFFFLVLFYRGPYVR